MAASRSRHDPSERRGSLPKSPAEPPDIIRRAPHGSSKANVGDPLNARRLRGSGAPEAVERLHIGPPAGL
jgi:hypothetical protein